MVQQVGFDFELTDRHRNTDDDHQALGDSPQARSIVQTDPFCGAAHQAIGQLRQQYPYQQHQRGTEYFRQIQRKHIERSRNSLQAKGFCSRNQKNK
ncbi:hypothetical protein D3C81_2076140 [compost metagenome]